MREIPYVSAVLGPAFGTACWFTQLSDFVVMRKDAQLAISSPRVTEIAIRQKIDPMELSGWRMQAEVTGKVDYGVDSDEEALDLVKKFLSYLPSPPQRAAAARRGARGRGRAGAHKLLELVPEDRARSTTCARSSRRCATRAACFRSRSASPKPPSPRSAASTARPSASSPPTRCSRPARWTRIPATRPCTFLVLCDSFNIPIIILVDTPGFLIGVEGERRKAPGQGDQHDVGVQMCTVPKFSIVMRKSYGQAYLNMGGTRNTDEMLGLVQRRRRLHGPQRRASTWFTA